jgi:hypothetical protein
MQRQMKKKSFSGSKKLEKTTDESFTHSKKSILNSDLAKTSTFLVKHSQLINDIDYICKSMQKQNRDSEVLINKMLDNCGGRTTSKTIRKTVKRKIKSKQFECSIMKSDLISPIKSKQN